MRVIIAGSRTIDKIEHVYKAVKKSGLVIKEVVSGKARGADRLGETWAIQNDIPIKDFPANWDKEGAAAGPKRNIEMGKYADAAIIIWDGQSKGSKHMISVMDKLNKPYYVYLVLDDPEIKAHYKDLFKFLEK